MGKGNGLEIMRGKSPERLNIVNCHSLMKVFHTLLLLLLLACVLIVLNDNLLE